MTVLVSGGSCSQNPVRFSSWWAMGPNRRHDSGHFPRQETFQPLTVVLIGCAQKAISHANEDKWGEPGHRCYNRTRINGLAPFLVQETAITEKNCDKLSKPSGLTRRRLRFPSARASCASKDSMEKRPL